MATRRKHRKNPVHHRRHRKNPASHRRYRHNPIGIDKSMLYMILAGGVGALAARMVPNMLKLTGIMDYAAKAAITVVGGMAGKKFVNANVGTGFTIGAGSILVTDLAKVAMTKGGGGSVAGYENVGEIEYVPVEEWNVDSEAANSKPYANTLGAYEYF